jgi:hypothetical protein
MLKERSFLPTILFLGVVILLVLAFSSNTYVPYSKETLFHEYQVYEGNEDMQTELQNEVQKEKKEGTEQPPSNANTNDSVIADQGQDMSQENTVPNNSETFENMYNTGKLGYAPVNMAENIDRFGDIVHVPTSGKCISAGLYTSHGPLCLTPELKKLLETRGDNM